MAMPAGPRTSPKASIEAECARRGREEVISGCIGLPAGHDADDGLIMALSNGVATPVLAGREGGRTGYWPRVWAARGLLHAWDDRAAAAIIAATADDHWRVREMAAKVIARYRVGDSLDAVVALHDDAVPRVRAAGQRAVAMLTAEGA
ncbi:MAG: hypothetical protein ACR2FU_09350 [Streptosporangiaceae bacterium]